MMISLPWRVDRELCEMAVALTVYISLHYLRALLLRDSVPHTSSPSNGAAGTEEVDVALSSLGQGAFVYLRMTSMFVGFRTITATGFYHPAPATRAASPLRSLPARFARHSRALLDMHL